MSVLDRIPSVSHAWLKKICTVCVWEFCALRRRLNLCLCCYNNNCAEMNLRKSAREVVCRGTLCNLTTVKSLCLQTHKLSCVEAKTAAYVNWRFQNTHVAGRRSFNWPLILWWPPRLPLSATAGNSVPFIWHGTFSDSVRQFVVACEGGRVGTV